MQAALYETFGGPIRVRTVPIPSLDPTREEHDGAVVLRVEATGVCRSDCHAWLGHDGDVRRHGLPFCPGHETSGVVAQAGRRVARFRPGDRVAVPFILSCGECGCCREGRPTVCSNQEQPGFTRFGSFAEFVLIPRADRNLCPIPPNVSFVQAAALGCRVSTAHRAVVQRARLLPGEAIAVFGAGGVGLACCMVARAVGCRRVIAVDASPAALLKATSVGATHTVLVPRSSSSSPPSSPSAAVGLVSERVRALTPGNLGAHVTVEAAGSGETCMAALYSTRSGGGGRMVQVGLLGGGPPVPAMMGLVTARELTILGSHGFDSGVLSELLRMASEGTLDPSRLVERRVTLEEGAQVLESMRDSSPPGIVMITRFGPPPPGVSRL
jgi:alcohol dehydrogenase